MKKLLLFLVPLLFLFLVAACSSDDDDGNSNNQYNPNFANKEGSVVPISEEIASYIIEVGPNNSYLIFKTSTPQKFLPSVGEMVCATVNPSTPNGFLGRITKVSTTDKGIEALSETVALDEAFKYLTLDESIDITSQLESITDADGNPVDFQIVDVPANGTKASLTQTIQFEPKLEYKYSDNKKAYAKFKASLSVSIDVNVDINGGVDYFQIGGAVKAGYTGTFGVVGDWKEEIGKEPVYVLNFPSINAGPLVISPKLNVYLIIGANGKVELQYKLDKTILDRRASIEYRKGKWSSVYKDNDSPNDDFYFDKGTVNFVLEGNVYLKATMGLQLGLYGEALAAEVTFGPKLNFKAKVGSEFLKFDRKGIELNYPNIINDIPKVTSSFDINGALKVKSKVWGINLLDQTIMQTDINLWSRDYSIFPTIKNFNAYGEAKVAYASMDVNPYYFFSLFSAFAEAKYGVALFDEEEKPIRSEVLGTGSTLWFPVSAKIDRCTYKFEDLSPGTTYYAAPMIKWGDKVELYGKKTKVETESKYELGMRCIGRDYDIITYTIDLDGSSNNSFTSTYTGNDYPGGGGGFSAKIIGKLDTGNNRIEGTIEMDFHSDPSQRRIDRFSVSLSDNTGYVPCSKVVNNGACTTAVRIVKQNDKTKSKAIYHYNPEDYDCNVGLGNPTK